MNRPYVHRALDLEHPDALVERFSPDRHDTSHFACGNPILDDYFRDMVIRDEAQHTAAAYVLLRRSDTTWPRRVIGYFTLSSFGLEKKQARRRDRDKHLGGYDPVPAALIGRLALDLEFQGQGLGGALVIAALTELMSIRERLGIAVAVVHAIDESAARFYEHRGFTRFRDEPNHLYFPLATFEALLAGL